ncbi:MAG: iron-sulfur cluster assembly accessory protein [Armatimonadetes bacterium]|nr:iron-sulfur cluster assembly accessory protein [Armatimonadota bacterium]
MGAHLPQYVIDGVNELSDRKQTAEKQPTGEFPVKVAAGAVARIKRIIEKEGKTGHFLRLGVKGGGCSGLEYVLKLDTRRVPKDETTEVDGLEVVIDPKSAKFLRGSTLEYTKELIGGGFRFDNPNAGRGCGCGASFTPKDAG